jgi:hypothetical protein
VGYIEQPRAFTGSQVFLQDSVGVLERHIPAAEFRYFCTRFEVTRVENGSQCIAHLPGSWMWFAGLRLILLLLF